MAGLAGPGNDVESNGEWDMPKVALQGSVGFGAQNAEPDVRAVKARLIDLGFDWLKADAAMGPETVRAIQLFQAIKNGFDRVINVKNDGRIDPGGFTHRWLEAVNAPRWVRMPPGSAADGYINDEVADASDNHDFGTDWLADTLRATGARYRDAHLKANPKASLLRINDASMPRGGDTPDHAGHETGLVCDVILPRRDGRAGGIRVGNEAVYDRSAMRAMIVAFLAQPLADRVLLSDPVLEAEKLCRSAAGHDNHAHWEIRPPVRKDD
jgi:hypothetical protein